MRKIQKFKRFKSTLKTSVKATVQITKNASGTYLKTLIHLFQPRLGMNESMYVDIKSNTYQVISLVSVVLVILSTVAMCLNTMPEFKIRRTIDNIIDNTV